VSEERDAASPARSVAARAGAANDDRARLFVALELPDTVRHELVEWRGRALAHLQGLRLIAREHLHVTLCFLGWRAVAEVDRIAAACKVAAPLAATPLALGEPLWLPPRRPGVLAVSLHDPHRSAGRLQATLSEALQAGGWYEAERRPYLPHVTVARVARRARVRPQELAPPAPIEFAGDQVTLYRSRLSRAGAHYEPLARFALSTA
jgi:2'-5' RNA ligase